MFSYIYVQFLKSYMLQTDCLASQGQNECNNCNLKTIYPPSHHHISFITIHIIQTNYLQPYIQKGEPVIKKPFW